MIAKTLVFVCAAFGLVAGSCFELVQPQCSAPCSQQVISIPVQSEPCPCSCSPVSVPVVAEPAPVCGNSFSEIFSSGSCGSCGPCGSSIPVSVVSSGSCCGVQPTNGPESSPVTVCQAPAVTLPAVEGPIITLCSPPIPAPRVLSQRCICTKTIVKPQVYQRTVTVPKIQRYLKRTVCPVVENVAYKSTPITQECSSSPVVISSGSSCGSRIVSAPVVVSSAPSCPRLC